MIESSNHIALEACFYLIQLPSLQLHVFNVLQKLNYNDLEAKPFLYKQSSFLAFTCLYRKGCCCCLSLVPTLGIAAQTF